MYTKILVPLDGSKMAEQILPYARLLAAQFEIPVELMTVIDTSLTDSHILGGKSRLLDSLVEQNVQSSREYLNAIANSFGGAEIKCTVEQGPTAEFIIHKANAAAGTLTALATHGMSGMRRWLIGGIASKVVQSATNPLLLLRPQEETERPAIFELRTIFVPLDGSGLGEKALPHAAELAKRTKSEVHLVRVYTLPANAYVVADGVIAQGPEQFREAMREEAETYLAAKAQELRAQGLDRVIATALEGDPANEIIDLANKTPNSVVAMSTHGRSGVGRWVLGSVAEKVIQHSHAPVLLLRAS